MKISFCPKQMHSKFSIAAAVAPKRSPRASLMCIRVEATTDGVFLHATDMENSIRIRVPGVEVDRPGNCLLQPQRFMSILKEVTDPKIKLTVDESKFVATVAGDRSRFKLVGSDPAEFPAFAPATGEAYLSLSAATFQQLIDRTEYAAASGENSRLALGGILLEHASGVLHAVGTDGKRLATAHGPCDSVNDHGEFISSRSTIVPVEAARLMARAIASTSDAKVKLVADPNAVTVSDEHVAVRARLLEGRFPRWRDVMPDFGDDATAIKVNLSAGSFVSTLRQAAIATSEESRGVEFDFRDGTLSMSAETAEVGQSQVEMPIAYDGPGVKTTLDHSLVSQFFKAVPGDASVDMQVSGDGKSPALLVLDDTYRYVVMPMSKDK